MNHADPVADRQEIERFQETWGRVRDGVGAVIVGQERVIRGVLTALFCGGNVLLEGVPGLGKTELVKALGRVLDLDFKRIQFTPDLMPADIIGTNIMNTDEHGAVRFEFRRGPIFTQLLLADEINRATPKTQSALLETMQERTVTVGETTHRLDPPFFVMATQNPIEQEGTYPLPEAQLDRFMFKLDVPLPDRGELNEIVDRTILARGVEVEKVLDATAIAALAATLDRVVVTDAVRDYAVRLVIATHASGAGAPEPVQRFIEWGASPRAAQALIRAARVQALADGRGHAGCDDVRAFAPDVLRHRLLLNYDGQAEGVAVDSVIAALLEGVPEDA